MVNITKVKELEVEFRGSMVRAYDIEYEPGSLGEYGDEPENCYPAEPEFVDFQVESGIAALDNILENDLRDEMTKIIIRELAYQELI